MRHGEAVPFALDDADRPLTPKGKIEAVTVGSHLKRAGWIPTMIFCSTRLRAKQTADLVADSVGAEDQAKIIEGITPEDEWEMAISVIEQHMMEGAIFVFHQPILTAIVGFLIEADMNFKVHPRASPGTAYHLRLDAVLPGTATLVGGYQP